MHVVIFLITVALTVWAIIAYLKRNGLFPPPLAQEPETTWED